MKGASATWSCEEILAVRNSEALDVFLKVAADSRLSWRAVGLAGRGISVDAASTDWISSVGKKSLGGEELCDLLMEEVRLVDALSEAWNLFDCGRMDDVEFEKHLEMSVVEFEQWAGGFLGN